MTQDKFCGCEMYVPTDTIYPIEPNVGECESLHVSTFACVHNTCKFEIGFIIYCFIILH